MGLLISQPVSLRMTQDDKNEYEEYSLLRTTSKASVSQQQKHIICSDTSFWSPTSKTPTMKSSHFDLLDF